MTQHTPGPWNVAEDHGFYHGRSVTEYFVRRSRRSQSCESGPFSTREQAETEADRLNRESLADLSKQFLAPVLSKACQGLLDAIHDSMTHAAQAAHAEQINAARAAIAKAEGGAQ